MVTTEQIKALREKTGISIAQCKQALEEASGDMDQAMAILRNKGGAIADKKSDRTLGAGLVRAYIHSSGDMGALVEIHSETDFVAKNDGLKMLAEDIAMQVAAVNPANIEELLAQPFIKDPSLTVADLIKDHIQKFGERIEIAKIVRFDASEM